MFFFLGRGVMGVMDGCRQLNREKFPGSKHICKREKKKRKYDISTYVEMELSITITHSPERGGVSFSHESSPPSRRHTVNVNSSTGIAGITNCPPKSP